jgi:hypothetical protein
MNINELINNYQSVCFSLYKCHKIHANRNSQYATVYNIITILITAFTGTASVSLLFEEYVLLKTTNVIFSYTAVVIGMIQNSYNPVKRYEQHKLASEHYISIYYEINEYKTFNEITEDNKDVVIWAKAINDKLEEYRKIYPYIEDNVYDNYKEEHITKSRNIRQSQLNSVKIL